MQTFDSGTILVYTHNPLILKIFSKLSKYIFYRKSPPHYLHNDISQRSINFFVNFCFGNKIFLPYFVTLVKNIPSLLNIFGGAKKSACWSPPSLSLHHMSVYPLRSARTTRSDPRVIPRKFWQLVPKKNRIWQFYKSLKSTKFQKLFFPPAL